MRISEVAEQTGLSIATIRYYERIGLCPRIHRGAGARRRFKATDVEWLTLLASLRETGMPMTEMARFADLYRRGDETVRDRKAMLLAHRESLTARRAALEHCAALLTVKLQKYDEIMGETQ